MFDQSYAPCIKMLEDFIDQAKQLGKEFRQDYRQQECVKDYGHHLKFFVDNNLLTQAVERQQKFKQFLKEVPEMIRNAK